ncbi:MAG: class I SAM-dependent methyltransferase [Patescibacteria group bacterium]
MIERYVYKGVQYQSIRDISDPSFVHYGKKAMRRQLYIREPMGASIISRPFDGIDCLAWKGVTLLPAKKTYDMALAVASIVDRRNSPCTIGEIGTGSGIFPITIASLLDHRNDITLVATDISGAALEAATINARINEIPEDLICWKKTDGLTEVSSQVPGFDIIFSNPPFTRTEKAKRINKSGFQPHTALDGGPNGAQFYVQFTNEAVPMLNRGGLLIFQLPLELDGIEAVIRSTRPLFQRVPYHLLFDTENRYTNPSPLFLTIGATKEIAQQFCDYKYRVVSI